MNEETQKLIDERRALVEMWTTACDLLWKEGLALPDEELVALTATITEHAAGAAAIKAYHDERYREKLKKKGPQIAIRET
jgi:hypothetical protein